ncbi:MAG: sulfatase [Candidatus Tectomicrobia bacterium]|nr:sulfatase [Candidatus Tectomicrobia bacterium]
MRRWVGRIVAGAVTGAGLGVVETYLLVAFISRGVFNGPLFTAWSVLHLLLVSSLLNGALFAGVGLAADAVSRALPRLRSRSGRLLAGLYGVLAIRVVFSGYLSPYLVSNASTAGRLLSNAAFLAVAALVFLGAWRLAGRAGAGLGPWAAGLGGALLLGGALGVASFPEVPAHYRGQTWRQVDAGLSRAPNVILVLVDTVRADHLSAYGYSRPTSPTLEEMAREGMIFEEFRSHANWTVPSVATLFTSLHESVTGMHTEFDRFPDEAETLAEVLQKRGFTTAFFSSNPLVGRTQNYTQGFDYALELGGLWKDVHYRNYQPPQQLYVWRLAYGKSGRLDRFLDWMSRRLEGLLNESGVARPGPLRLPRPDVADIRLGKADWVFRHTRAYLDHLFSQGYDARRNKLFLYLHYMDPHQPYRPPGAYKRMFDPGFRGSPREMSPNMPNERVPLPPDALRSLVAQYDGEIRFFDDWLGELVRYLKGRGLYDTSLFILTADHGEGFWDHESWDHGYTVFEEEIRVPLVVRLPGKIPAGVRNKDLAGLADVMPTVLDVLGLPQAGGIQGDSLLPVIRGERAPRVFYGEATGHEKRAFQFVISEGKKYIARFGATLSADPPFPFQKGMLFDLRADPKERRNLFRPGDPESVRYGDLLKRKREEVLRRGRLPKGSKVLYDPETLERLRRLGYIGD